MDSTEFVLAFAKVFGTIAGLGVLALTFKVGRRVGTFEDTLASTASLVGEVKDSMTSLADTMNSRVAKLEFNAWGVDGNNGEREKVKIHGQRLDNHDKAITDLRVATTPRRKASRSGGRRNTDK